MDVKELEQSALDKIYKHFIVKRKPPAYDRETYTRMKSADEYNTNYPMCMLRDPEGNKCAIGVLIPKGLYYEDLEEMSIHTMKETLGSEWKYAELPNEFMGELQGTHDTAVERMLKCDGEDTEASDDFYEIMEYQLKGVARQWGLTCPE